MDFTFFLTQILQYFDPLVCFVTIIMMEIIRRIIPDPASDCLTRNVPPIVNRFVLPVLPLIIAPFWLIFVIPGRTSATVTILLAKGLVSGALSSYLYRQFKVVFLGQ